MLEGEPVGNEDLLYHEHTATHSASQPTESQRERLQSGFWLVVRLCLRRHVAFRQPRTMQMFCLTDVAIFVCFGFLRMYACLWHSSGAVAPWSHAGTRDRQHGARSLCSSWATGGRSRHKAQYLNPSPSFLTFVCVQLLWSITWIALCGGWRRVMHTPPSPAPRPPAHFTSALIRPLRARWLGDCHRCIVMWPKPVLAAGTARLL